MKISKLENVIPDYFYDIKDFSRLSNNNYDALFIEWDYFIEYQNKIANFRKNDLFKIFVFVAKKNVNITFDKDYIDMPIYSIIPNSFGTKRIQKM
ncbi:MAG TPA: hypothetical protein PLO89_01535, partial [Spirochaetota bacterium]|nr:hypothetical protein [Spirochaetota bacterium]